VTEPAFEVVDGGLLTTVQDAGRPAWTHLGVPESGAADPWSLAVANLLVGNEAGAAALEMTVIGPSLVARSEVTIGLAGADLGARIEHGRALPIGRSHRLAAGDVLTFGAGRGAAATDGIRGYLAIAGGVDVPLILGSRSTCLPGGFGGLAGRALRTGDRVDAGPWTSPGPAGRPPRSPAGSGRELVWPEAGDDDRASGAGSGVILRLIAGPDPRIDALVQGRWRVGSAFDRVGVRLDGEPLAGRIGGETTSHGLPWGAVQVPPDGRPIILGADHQTTGGYRVLGVVISADLPILGQLRPGTDVRLVAIDRTEALGALVARRDALVAGAAALREAAGWSALIDAAGG
jgi:antagonist of KipI